MRYVHVDVFTSEAFCGNPAAVCMAGDLIRDDEWLPRVAAELNLPVSVFLRAVDDSRFDVRFFTPARELAACGHGTVAAVHVLHEAGLIGADGSATFHTPGGDVKVGWEGGHGWLELPAGKVTRSAPDTGALAALGVAPMHVTWFGGSELEFVVDLDSPARVTAVRPDFDRVAALPVQRVLVTALGADVDGADFLSRVFCPAMGTNEDYVTGSAHAVLGPYWANRLGRTELVGRQCSQRPGNVSVLVRPDIVRIGGAAVTVGRGVLSVVQS